MSTALTQYVAIALTRQLDHDLGAELPRHTTSPGRRRRKRRTSAG